MIEKMKFLSITGPKADIDRVTNTYLSKYEIHLENALAQLQTVQNLSPYIQINPYKEILAKANDFAGLLDKDAQPPAGGISLEDSITLIEDLDQKLTRINQKRSDLESQKKETAERISKVEPFLGLSDNLSEILNFKYIKFRFGRIAREYFSNFEEYVYDKFDTVFYPCNRDDRYIWGVYFCPRDEVQKIDAVYSSMHFERFFIPEEYHSAPAETHHALKEQLQNTEQKIAECEEELRSYLHDQAGRILAARDKLSTLSRNFDVRKLAACTREDRDTFYILCGWMSKRDADAFLHDISNDTKLYCFVEDDTSHLTCTPPTKLKNPRLFRPFEMFVKMYGLPAYNEIDPTIFVALTYTFIFGAMFGDAGQGFCLMVGGFLLYHFRKIPLAAIIGLAGIFSTIFGFLFGSFFGFEDVLPALWIRPTEAMTSIPGLGSINTVFVVAIAFGMFLILVTMVFHIINGIRSRETENIWFDQNAVCGLVFYGSLTAVIALLVTGHHTPAVAVLAVMFGVPLILIMLKEPLTRLADRHTPAIEGSKPMFFVQNFFELFEVCLSYLSNTLSFIRIGAFAVSHAAMMEVVLMLAGAAEGGSPNWIVIVLGNIFVCAMEGLIVGIQVLRLEYYEMFSRFYKGDGREFSPFIRHSSAPAANKQQN